MAESNSKKEEGLPPAKPLKVSRVDFIVSTYPDLQPFLEMAIVLLEGVYDHMKTTVAPTNPGKPKCK